MARRKSEFIIGEIEAIERENMSYRRFDVRTEKEGLIGFLYLKDDVGLNPERLLLKQIDCWITPVVW